MEPTKGTILVLGSGHLATQTCRVVRESGFKAIHVLTGRFKEQEDTPVLESALAYAKEVLVESGIADARGVCIVDREDKVNLHLMLAALSLNHKKPVLVALRSETLTEHVESAHQNVDVCNPAASATVAFVEALNEEVAPPNRAASHRNSALSKWWQDTTRIDTLIYKLLIAFFGVFLAGALFFHATEGVSWIDSFHIMATLITSVEFGSSPATNFSPWIKALRIAMLIGVYTFTVTVIALIIDHLTRRHSEHFQLGRRRYGFLDHIIVCGLGRYGYPIVERLLERGRKVVVIESDERNRFIDIARSRGAEVLVGDANLPRNLLDAGVKRAAALVSAVNDDLINLEVGLNARAANPRLRIVLRMFDQDTAREIQEKFDIRFTLSTSLLVSDEVRAFVQLRCAL